MTFNLENYVEVKDRIPLFKKQFEDARITTQVIYQDADSITIMAFLWRDGIDQAANTPLATGIAKEKDGGYIDKYVENCETSAICRALGILGYDVCNSIASADEVERAISQQGSLPTSTPAPTPRSPTPAPPPASVGGGAAGPAPDGTSVVDLRRLYENETPKGTKWVKVLGSVDGKDIEIECWEEAAMQTIRNNCPGQIAAIGEHREFRGKPRFKVTRAYLMEAAPVSKKETFDDSDIPF